jgi:hypothetical protein
VNNKQGIIEKILMVNNVVAFYLWKKNKNKSYDHALETSLLCVDL